MKKLVSIVLALALVLLCVGAAFASETNPGSITVTNQLIAAGATSTTFEVYRIFDVSANADYTSLTYTINNNFAGFFASGAAGASYIVDTNDTTANSGDGYTPIVVNGAVKYIALTDSNVAAFGKAALAYSQANNVSPVASNTTGSFSDLPLGYYMIYPKGANLDVEGYSSIVSLTTTKPGATVVQKAQFPTLEKTDDDDSVEVGQTVHYTLTSKVPDTTGYTTFDFTMHDQMTAGLTFDGESSIVVTIGTGSTAVTVPASGEKSYTYATETPASGYETAFKIDIPVMSYQDHKGETITVTYTAHVNDNAVIHIDKNHATLEYSNNPKDDDSHTTTPPDEEEVFSAKIVIDKYDGSNTSAKLAGAKFVLRCKSVQDASLVKTATAQPGKYYKYTAATDSTPAKVEWVDETAIDTKVTSNTAALETDIAEGATVATTDTNGAAEFPGLENGVYELIEVAAPAGYNQIKGVAAEVTVNGNKTETASLTATSQIANNAGTELPSTGGIGTTIFYILGGILVIGAAVILVARRKAHD